MENRIIDGGSGAFLLYGTVIVFFQEVCFYPRCSLLPAFMAAYSSFVILFVGQCNQMKGKYSQKNKVIVSDHCIEPSNVHFNAEWITLSFSSNLRHSFVTVSVLFFFLWHKCK